MPKPQPFTPDPFELALAERLGLPLDEVIAGSLEVVEGRRLDGGGEVTVRWRQFMGADAKPKIEERYAELPYADVQEIRDSLARRLGS